MKCNRFPDERIIGILKEHDAGTPVSELCRKHGVSDASIYKWKAKFGGMDVSEAKRMKALAHERRRFGYRRLHVLLRREGHLVNHKRLFRLYREEKLTVRERGGRKRAIGTRSPMLIPLAANDRWSLDFVSDQLTDGRRFRVLTVVDDCTRECLGLVADTSLSGLRVARELDRIIEGRGKPKMIVSDNGSEFTSNAICNGRIGPQWNGTTSHRASRSRTPSSKASMGGCETSS